MKHHQPLNKPAPLNAPAFPSIGNARTLRKAVSQGHSTRTGHVVVHLLQALALLVAFACATIVPVMSPALAQSPVQGLAPRQSIVFEINRLTTVGQSVFVVGNTPELGDDDLRLAPKLSAAAYPLWRATISLPAGKSFTYRYIIRNDAPGQTSLATNGSTFAGPFTITTSAQATATRAKALWLTWNRPGPILYWRTRPTPGTNTTFAALPLQRFGASDPARLTESRFFAWNFSTAGDTIEFYFNDATNSSRYPAFGNYTTSLDGVYIQDGQLYSYIPAAAPQPARRAYSPGAVPTIFSPQLNEIRGYRVFLPRGYDQHTTRRYPVLYMHDGQNVFESGSFGSWNAATTITNAQAASNMREAIVVGLDNGPNRLTDYLPPGDFLTGAGRADRYLSYVRDTVKPFIDANFRTNPSDTGLLGSSMGGVVSLYGVWDFTSTFTRGGLLSGAWQTCPNFLSRVRATPMRPVRMWLDSGDSGTSNDNYWATWGLRDHFVEANPAKAALSGAVAHAIGYGQQHNEAAWTIRLPLALAYLYPAQEEPNDLVRTVFGPHWDVNFDNAMTIDDLAMQSRSPRDLDFSTNGTNSGNLGGDATDTMRLVAFLRRLEREAMIQGRR